MAKLVKRKYPKVDAFLSSPAVRAYETCKFFMQAYGKDIRDVSKEFDLYHASESEFMSVIQEVDEGLTNIALFSHNPGLTYFANRFTPGYIDNVPTCGVVVLESKASCWSDVHEENTRMVEFLYPKKDLLYD